MDKFGSASMLLQFFGFGGRIGRGTWWIAQAIMVGSSVLLDFFTDSKTSEWQALLKSAKPNSDEAFSMLASMGNWFIIFLVYGIISTWMFLSTGVQRLHDRNSSGWRILFAYAPLLMIFAAVYILIVQQSWGSFTLLILMTCIAFVVTFVWQLVELGCLSGDDCENDYGDPPGASRRKSALERELAELRGDDKTLPIAQYSMAPATPRLATPSGPVTFGKR
jgi:uncharacterized membrane protein YhaH (DUF805 family)